MKMYFNVSIYRNNFLSQNTFMVIRSRRRRSTQTKDSDVQYISYIISKILLTFFCERLGMQAAYGQSGTETLSALIHTYSRIESAVSPLSRLWTDQHQRAYREK